MNDGSNNTIAAPSSDSWFGHSSSRSRRRYNRSVNGLVVCVTIVSVAIGSYSYYVNKEDRLNPHYKKHQNQPYHAYTVIDVGVSNKSLSSSLSSSEDIKNAVKAKMFARNDQLFKSLPRAEQNKVMAMDVYWDEWVKYGFEKLHSSGRSNSSQASESELKYNSEPEPDRQQFYEGFYQLEALRKQWASGARSPLHLPIPPDGWDVVDNVTCVREDTSGDRGDNQYLRWNGRQVPAGIILGSQKGGSTALSGFLERHPLVAPTEREIHYLSYYMDISMTGTNIGWISQDQQHDEFTQSYQVPVDGGINQSASQYMYMQMLQRAIPTNAFKKKQLQNQKLLHATSNNDLYGEPMLIVDKSPSYSVLSDRVPYRLLCTCPWAKLVLLLRNPIDRAYSQYNMIRHSKDSLMLQRIPSTFDEWVEQDYQILLKLGVIRPIDQEEDGHHDDDLSRREEGSLLAVGGGYRGTLEERRGWKAYTRLGTAGPVGPIGRGLYSIQLSGWIEAYEKAGRDLLGTKSSSAVMTNSSNNDSNNVNDNDEKILLVLSSDFTKTNPDEALALVCDHLGLPRIPLPSAPASINQGIYDDGTIEPMSNRTRDRLQKIFEPYNRQLADLLGDEWKGIWT